MHEGGRNCHPRYDSKSDETKEILSIKSKWFQREIKEIKLHNSTSETGSFVIEIIAHWFSNRQSSNLARF